MDEATKIKHRDLEQRAEAMRRFAADRPNIAKTLIVEAERLEAEATALLRMHSDEHDASAPTKR